ncbi:MAG TPA: DnaJ domain-containing protein [Chryseosolibacter sp.]|nr:DnaJ domain-containing protein [Chryseosolibacter sp.]
MKDYYAILGVSANATASEIKKAFRKLAILYHPDKNPSPEARPRFHEINEAYDVLGDAVKRAQYDERLANPFAALFNEPVRTHPDPAYRRTRRPRPARPKGPPESYLLMRKSLKYVMWVSRTGLIVTLLFFVDYFLPYAQSQESIVEMYSVRGRGNNIYHIIRTSGGEEIRVYDFSVSRFGPERVIIMDVTPIYNTVMSVSNRAGTYTAWVAYTYTTMIFFPILLFVNSLLAVIYRKRVEFCFNLNVTACILLIINLVIL